jgi:hypothetical protein
VNPSVNPWSRALSLGLAGAVVLIAQAQAETPIALQDLVGVWKMAYAPGLPGVSELDDGYLVLYPDGSYVQASSQVDDDRSAFVRGSFTYAAGVVELERTDARLSDGADPGYVASSRIRRLHLQPRSPVVFFDRRECLVETLVLTADSEPRDLHYSWALALGGGLEHAPVPRHWEPCDPSEPKGGRARP